MTRLAATLGVHGQAKSSLREETEIEDAMNSLSVPGPRVRVI